MAISYAPYIESTIPAFGPVLKIPYQMNKAVNWDQVIYFVAKIMDVNNNLITYLTTEDKTKNVLSFSTNNSLKAEQYYKIQLAYAVDRTTEYADLTYSSIGIGKYFGNTNPSITMTPPTNNIITVTYDPKTSNENLYSWVITNLQGTILQEILHTSNTNSLSFLYTGTVAKYIQAKTVNGYVTDEDKENIVLEPLEIKNELSNQTAEYKIGDHKITLPKDTTCLKVINDQYCPFKTTDFCVEVGDTGIYYDLNTLAKIITKIKFQNQELDLDFVDYEDMYLQDISKTLCIKFNPKVSSFKTTLQESKQDTIGGKYPFFYRNGTLGYKEFSINGLISYHMDENEEFMKQEKLGLSAAADKAPTHNLTGYNIAAERKFRNAVLDWLNNGEVKLFKSPTEGMFLVRLMNISLSPEEKLGRMIYSFSATAYEVDEINYETLLKHKLISKIEGIDYVIR